MSVMYCERCDRHIDTDFDVEGEYEGDTFICGSCVEARATENPPTTDKGE